jgi:hypothetical protein
MKNNAKSGRQTSTEPSLPPSAIIARSVSQSAKILSARSCPTRPQGQRRVALRPPELIRKSQLKVLLHKVREQTETVQILFWLVMSGAIQLMDAVMLKFSSLDLESGLISYNRFKSGTSVHFGAVPPLIELLKQRRQRLGLEAVYVFPELMKSTKQTPHSTEDPDDIPRPVARQAGAKATNVLKGFFHACGMPETISYRTLRLHQISFLLACGIRETTMQKMWGCRIELFHHPALPPVEDEILQVRDSIWNYLESIMQNRPCAIPVSEFPAYGWFLTLLDRIPPLTQSAVKAELTTAMARQKAENDRVVEEFRDLLKQLGLPPRV